MRRLLMIAGVSCCLAAGGALPAAGSSTVVPSTAYLFAFGSVDAVSSTDVWVAGSKVPYGGQGQDSVPVIEHYNGKSWREVSSYQGNGDLSSVAAVGPKDVWAVGERYVGGGVGSQVLALHWNGKSWQDAQPPPFPGQWNDLHDVSGIAANHVLFNGIYYTGEGDPTRIHLLWDGSAWSQSRRLQGLLFRVSTLSPADAWGAGEKDGQGVAARWNGKRWKNTHPQVAGGVFEIAALSDSDVWLTDAYSNFQHWNGHKWTPVADAAPDGATIDTLSGTGSDDVWAGGYTNTQGVLEHWDGHQWSNVDNPCTGQQDARVWGVEAITRSDAWAVGNNCNGGEGLLMHWDGHTWTQY